MPATSVIERETVIAAPPAAIVPLVADLHRWVEWSPWEGQDPDLHRTYTGTPGTVGATYAWKGNRRAGAGTMTVTRIESLVVEVDLRFTAPFRSSSTAEFRLHEGGGRTRVVWTMTSPQTAVSRIMRTVLKLDDLIGRDFEKGLSQLRTVAER